MSPAVSSPAQPVRYALPKGFDFFGKKPKITLQPVPFGLFLLLVLGFLLATEVRLIGILLVGEVLLIPVAVLSIGVGLRRVDMELWKFAGFYTLTLLAYIVADLVNGSAMNDALRGWARVGFVIVALVAMRLILKKSRFNLFPICAGMLLGHIVFQMVLGDHKLFSRDGFAYVWKFYISTLAVACGLYLISWFSKRFMYLFSCLFLCAAGVFSVIIDTRGTAGFCLVVAGVLGARLVAAQRLRTLLPMFLVGGVLLAGLVSWLLLSETNDAFGSRRSLSNVSRIADIITATDTIAQHPILGVGSWTQLAEASDRHRQTSRDLGQAYEGASDSQSGHSQVIQAWTEAGIFAALAFMYYLWRLLLAVKWILRKPLDRFYAVDLFFVINGIWACLFSPFNGSQRIYIGIIITICIALREEQKLFDRNVNSQRRFIRQLEIERARAGSSFGLQSA